MSKDNYVGLVIDDEGTEIPANATLSVTLHSATWEQFETNVAYVKGLELPGLGETRQLSTVGVYREAEPEGGPKVTVIVTVPVQDNQQSNARHIEEVLNRVELAA